MKPSALIVVVLAAVVSAAAIVGSSRATLPGRNGRIAYMVQDQAGHWQVWVANSDLSGAKKLTHGRHDSGWAVWSPNGKRLAFDSNRTDHTPNNSRHVNEVFLMKPDGSGVKKLTDSKGVSGDAAWSPNGKLIAFDSDRGNRNGFSALYVMNATRHKIKRITKPARPLSDYEPRFSPDGTHLVFARARGTAGNAPAALFTVRLNGSNLRRLTPFTLHVGGSDWSPNGKQIVFEAYPSGPYGDIYLVDAAGGTPVNLTDDTTGQADPVWSPDGQKILFLDNGFVNGVGRTGLATMKPDGSRRGFILSKNLEAHQADWESIAAASPAPKIAALTVAEAAAHAARTDSQLAKRLVVAYRDQSLAQYGNPVPGAVPAARWQCLAQSGFSLTARASSFFGGPHTGLSSVASVLKTKADARRYYRVAVRTISGCERQMLQDGCSQPPGCAVGSPHALAFPPVGDQSVGGRIPIAYAGAPDASGFELYNNDWVVVRKGRAVLADDFFAWEGWPSQAGAPAVPSLNKEERHIVRREFVRAHRPPAS
jgi:TolB protein